MLHISVFQCILQYLHLKDLRKRILSYAETFAFLFGGLSFGKISIGDCFYPLF